VKLSDIACRSAKPEDKQYKRFDGGGLYLLVKPNGSKLWQLKYRYLGKEKTLSLGAYPLITLAEARDGRDDAKKLLAKNIDPSAARKENKAAIIRNADNTFKAIALEWYDNKKDAWSIGHAQKVWRILEMNAFPDIGARPLNQIKPPELLECLRKVEKRGALEIASKTKQICGQVFRYGIQTGRCEWNAADNLTGALKTKRTEHFRSLDFKQLPDFLKVLERNEARLFERTRRAVWLSLYTFCRPVEIRKARWQDINYDEAIWTIPAEFMKMKRDHVVPMSDQVMRIFKAQQEEVGHINTEWVFPSQHKSSNPMSDGTVNKAIKSMGYGKDMVAHGFRALARTTIREKLKFDSEVIERQLAHKASGALGEAYDRTQFLDERAEMMQEWADYLERLYR
jgi:integrase